MVPPEHFEQVLDFAELYEFNVSEGAQQLEAEARLARDAAMVARVAEATRSARPQPGLKPGRLEVPEDVEVADEFKD
jgi:hypothetical protein